MADAVGGLVLVAMMASGVYTCPVLYSAIQQYSLYYCKTKLIISFTYLPVAIGACEDSAVRRSMVLVLSPSARVVTVVVLESKEVIMLLAVVPVSRSDHTGTASISNTVISSRPTYCSDTTRTWFPGFCLLMSRRIASGCFVAIT